MNIISPERKDAIIKKILSLHDKSIAQLAKEEGIGKSTLYTWKSRYLSKPGKNMSRSNNSSALSAETKFMMVVETATLPESEKNQYCREKGVYPEQLAEWRVACMHANTSLANKKQCNSSEIKKLKKQINTLEKELKYKDRALSETAALLVLRKKLHALWGDVNEEG